MKHINSCIACINLNCLLKSCSHDWILQIEEHKLETMYKKGQKIFNVGDYVDGLFFIKKGKVKVISNGLNNKEHIVRLATDSHILGHRGLGAETYPVGAIAMNESLICFVENETISNAFYYNPDFTIKLMLFYSEELRGMEARITYLAQMTVRERVAFSLLYLKDMFGYTSDSKTLNVYLSRADIAGLCGTSIEQVIRNISDFEKEKFIAKEGKTIRITNENGLLEMLDMYNLKLIFKKDSLETIFKKPAKKHTLS